MDSMGASADGPPFLYRPPRCCCCTIRLFPLILIVLLTHQQQQQQGGVLLLLCRSSSTAPPPRVFKIGALLDSSAPIGRRCLDAIQLAVAKVNTDPMLLNGTLLSVLPADSNCSAFTGAAAATSLLQSEVVVIAGPQSSEVSQFVAHMAAHTRVPLVSFAATDPALSEHQYPFFVRLAWSDSQQMSVVAALVEYYGWRRVVALYVDEDDAGQNGVDVLGDSLASIGATMALKASVKDGADDVAMAELLTRLNTTVESRVYVVHMPFSATARSLFLVASRLQMLSTGYVWIVTHSIAEALSLNDLDMELLNASQGVIGVCMYVDPGTPQLQSFLAARNEATGRTDWHYYAFELLAYESAQMIAFAVDRFLKQGHSLSFQVPSSSSSSVNGSSTTDLSQLKVLTAGRDLLSYIRDTSFDNGITGPVVVDERGDAQGISFQITNVRARSNVDGEGVRSVGFWYNGTLSDSPPPAATNGSMTPTDFYNDTKFAVSQPTGLGLLGGIIWPGGSDQVPRGWMLLPKATVNGKSLTIGVPNKTGYREFVTTINVDPETGKTVFQGFCIDVFEKARQMLPYSFEFEYKSFGDGIKMPNYSELVNMVADKKFDAVVGDVTITPARSKLVDFTQPFATSGLVVVVPLKAEQVAEIIHAWAFMHPFTPAMWCTTAAFFLLTGIIIWILEHKKNRHFRGRPSKQFVTTLWFIFSTLFFSQRENVKSTLGRAVLVIWLFVVLIITSSYTASLTSMLTVEQLSYSIQGIDSLVASDVPIGYQTGSFVEAYLLQLHVPKRRLVALASLPAYAHALSLGAHSPGGVGAIVDELPYVQLLLSSQCDFSTAGQEFTKGGWGFAFPKGSQLAIDISNAILKMSEDGSLERIHDKWLSNQTCVPKSQPPVNELNIRSFWGLYLITGVTSVFCVLCYLIRMAWEYKKSVKVVTKTGVADPDVERRSSSRSVSAPAAVMRKQRTMSARFRRGASFLKSLAAFIEEEETPAAMSMSARERIIHRSSSSSSIMNSGLVDGQNGEPHALSCHWSDTPVLKASDDTESECSVDGPVPQRTTQAELFQLLRDLSTSFKSGSDSGRASAAAAERSCNYETETGDCMDDESRWRLPKKTTPESPSMASSEAPHTSKGFEEGSPAWIVDGACK